MSRKRQSGQVLPMMAVIMVATLGLTGLITDIGNYFYQNRVQQNAAESASHAATTYWVSRFGVATDTDLYCIARLYASSGDYASLVPGTCPAANPSVPNNSGAGTTVYYVDAAGAEIAPAGTLGAVDPLQTYANATGIKVKTSSTAAAFFSRLFSITGFAVRDNATNRIGTVISVTNSTPVIEPVPGGTTQSGLSVFPASFKLSTYQAATKYSPFAAIVAGQTVSYSPSCADFCWSGLQCTGNHGNSTVSTWLNGGQPCPDMPGTIATYNSPLCTSNPPSSTAACTIAVDPGVRAADFSAAQANFAGKVVLMPVVDGTKGYDKVVQFAYFFVTSASGPPAKTINGFFLDPAQMPLLPAGIAGPCVPGSFVPCSVLGG